MLRTALSAALLALLAPALRAQTCAGGENFLKNDVLPANPGQQQVAVIQGLCEGEAAGCVFDISSMGGSVKVNLAAIGFIQAGGVQGTPAAVNLKIYDGITWNGGIPTLGPEIFDFGTATGGSIQVVTSAINTMDVSQFNITASSTKLVVTWWMEINAGPGSCSQGYQANFATDYPTGNPNCNVLQKNLIYILGQGWRDAATATVQGFPLCPVYYAGNWLIRACVQPAGAFVPYCAGDGSLATGCPCGNNGAPGHGCENSQGTGGALLTVTGNVSPDTVVLTSSNELPTPLSIFIQGNINSANGLVFGDGVRCAAGALKRLYVKNASGGVVSAPTGSQLSITARSAVLGDPISPGNKRYYQVYYRDPNPNFCPPNTFNSSSAMKITW